MSEFDKGIKLESKHHDIFMTDVMIKPIGREKILSISSLMAKHTSELKELRKEVAETKTSFKELDTFISKNYLPLSTLKQVIEEKTRAYKQDLYYAEENLNKGDLTVAKIQIEALSDLLTAITKLQTEGK